MPDFDTPLSRNELILQNICGADNELSEPQSRVEALLQAIYYKYKVETPEELEETLAVVGIAIVGNAIVGHYPFEPFEPESRIEKILFAILTDDTYTAEAQSRNEEILKAILTDGTYTEEPQSRIEELLLDWLALV